MIRTSMILLMLVACAVSLLSSSFVFGGPDASDVKINVIDRTSKELDAFYRFGGIADGASHPLRTIKSVNGQSTEKFSVEQWKALYINLANAPEGNPVTDLSNEIDEVALQAAINANETTSVGVNYVYIPQGQIQLTHPVRTGCRPTVIRGSGQFTTMLVQRGLHQDGWHHGLPDTGCPGTTTPSQGYGHTLALYEMSFVAANYAGTAIAMQCNHQYVGHNIENVTIAQGTAATHNFWHDGITSYDCSGATLRNNLIFGVTDAIGATGGGLRVGGSGTGSWNILGGQISSWSRCVIIATGTPAGLPPTGDAEGMSFDGIQGGNCNMFDFAYSGQGGQAAQFYCLNSQFGSLPLPFITGSNEAEVKISNNLTYSSNPHTYVSMDLSEGASRLGVAEPINGLPAVGDIVSDVYGVIPKGTTVKSVSGAKTYVVALSNPTSAAHRFDMVIFRHVNTVPNVGSAQTITGSTTSGRPYITGLTAYALQMMPGGSVTGPGIPPGTTLIAIDASTATAHLSNNATSTTLGRPSAFSFGYPMEQDFMTIVGFTDANIYANTFLMGPGHNFASAGAFTNNHHVRIDNNQVYDYGPTMKNVYRDGTGNSDFVERDTMAVLTRPYVATVAGPLASGPTTRWELFFKSKSCDLMSTGDVQCRKSTIGRLDANGELSILLPPVFITPPLVDASNGDVGVLQTFCGPQASSIDRVAFRVKCPGARHSLAKINWLASGR